MTAVIETSGLTKRYRRVTALSDCTISVPEGRISALVGPNGAGKTTLLRLLAGLAAPTAGRAAVLGGTPRQDPAYLAEIGFLAQEIPLYRRLTAEDHIGIGAHLNPRWDGESVRARLGGLKIPLDRPAGTLSGGQRAQLALALTLAKRPRLLLLDEPLAALDPLARRNFLAALAEAAAGGDLTIVLSSHLIADIERVCDHLILLAESRVQLCGDTETPARAAPDPDRPAQGHDGDRADARHRAGRHHRAADHAAGQAERPGDRSRLGRRGTEPGGDSARLHEPGRRRPRRRSRGARLSAIGGDR